MGIGRLAVTQMGRVGGLRYSELMWTIDILSLMPDSLLTKPFGESCVFVTARFARERRLHLQG